jgi:hypothetical protein
MALSATDWYFGLRFFDAWRDGAIKRMFTARADLKSILPALPGPGRFSIMRAELCGGQSDLDDQRIDAT